MTVGDTVLIVDDHPSFRRSARTLLEAEGYVVVGEAADGGSALAQVARLHPQIVLLDVALPDMDGFAVAERLATSAAAESSSAPAVVLVSSRDGADFGPLVARSGARGFVPKAELSAERLQELV